jgi:hypothetical protein
MEFDDLERLVDRELKRTPAPRAPETLLPRVMLAVRAARAAQPPVREWMTWPVSWQVASMAAAVLIAIGLWRVLPWGLAALSALFIDPSTAFGSQVASVIEQLQALAGAGRVIWRVLGPLAIYGVGFIVVMMAACAVFGTALGRIAWGGASRI